MKYNVVIEELVTKTYGTRGEIDADNESQGRERAEDIAMEVTLEEIEAEWESGNTIRPGMFLK